MYSVDILSKVNVVRIFHVFEVKIEKVNLNVNCFGAGIKLARLLTKTVYTRVNFLYLHLINIKDSFSCIYYN